MSSHACWFRLVVVAVAAIVADPGRLAGAGEAPPQPPPPATQPTADTRPLVLVFSRRIGGTSCGNGFVVGDGTLIVTARHVVFPERLTGLHQGDAFVTILSPYLGQPCEADVLAQDRELDLCLLRAPAPWKGHPAIQLADDADIVAAESVTLAGFTDALSVLTAAKASLVGATMPPAQVVTLPIDSVTVRKSATRTIVTAQAPPGPSWAGAPLVIGGVDEERVAGCYARTQGDGTAGLATAAMPVRKLIESIESPAAMVPTPQRLAAPEKSAEAAALYLQSVAASAAREPEASSHFLQMYLALRPNSAIAYRDAAGQAHAAKRLIEAQQLYEKALALDPSLISARVLYGQLLHERVLPDNALQHLRYAWENGRGSTAAVIPICNILREQGKEKDCIAILEEAVKKGPRDAFLWNYLGQSRRTLNDHAGAAAAFARSADLMPENAPVRTQAGEQFEAAGDRKSAEEQYRLLIRHDPDNAAGHYFLARSLAHDSSRREEAMREAEAALRLCDRPGAPPKPQIQALISAIRAGRATPEDQFKL